jgi:hypothetical protein
MTRRLLLLLALASCRSGPAPSDADRALTAAIARARAARTAQDACAGLPELSRRLDRLQRLVPSPGREQELAERRNGLIMRMDALQHQTCADPEATPEMVAEDLDGMRARLAEVEALAAGR